VARRDHALSREIIHKIITNPATYPSEAGHVVAQLRDALTYGPTGSPDPEADGVRQRALNVLIQLLKSAQKDLREIEMRHAGTTFNRWPKADQDTTRSLMQLIDSIGSQIYFASGAYDATGRGKQKGIREVTPQSKRFYQEAGAALDELAKSALPSVAQHLVETLEYFIADRIVHIVERYLAEYRTLLQEDADCRKALIGILDVFVEAGWPCAQRLVYRLEEIFR